MTVTAPHNATAWETPCEVCGKPSAWILARRTNLNGPGGQTVPNPEAPVHPRCMEHSGCAWEMDGKTFNANRSFK